MKEIVCGYQGTEGFRERGVTDIRILPLKGREEKQTRKYKLPSKMGRNTDYVLHQPAVDNSVHSQPLS